MTIRWKRCFLWRQSYDNNTDNSDNDDDKLLTKSNCLRVNNWNWAENFQIPSLSHHRVGVFVKNSELKSLKLASEFTAVQVAKRDLTDLKKSLNKQESLN